MQDMSSPPQQPRFVGPRAASATAVDLPAAASVSAFKAKEVADFAKHYGRCYWELSKARLRLSVFLLFLYFNSLLFSFLRPHFICMIKLFVEILL